MIRRLRTSVLARLATTLAVLMMGGVVLAGPAAADCWGDWSGKPQVPGPQAPNSGFSGTIDPGFGPGLDLNPGALETIPDFGPYVSSQYVRPPAWSAYDEGCKPDPAGTAGWQSTVGNLSMGGASVLTSITSAIHRQVSPPDLHFLDSIVRTGTQAVKDALFNPWIGTSFLLLAGWLVLRAMRGELHGVFTTGAAAVVLVGLAAVLVNQSVQMASYFDGMASDTVGGIYKTMSPDAAGNPFDPASPRAGAVTDVVLWQNWLRGELGDPNSEVAKKYGARLLNDTAYTQAEWAQIQADHTKEKGIDKTKGDDFTKAAKEIKDDYPHAYRILQGKTGDRGGAGFMAFLSALCVTPFLAFADLLLFMGLLMVRVAVVVFPAIVIVAIFPRFRHLATGLVETVGQGLFSAFIFAAASAFDLMCIQQLVGPDAKIERWFGLVLCAILSIVLWKLCKPKQRFKDMTSVVRDPLDRATAGLRAKRDKVRSTAKQAAAGAAGTSVAGPQGGAIAAAAVSATEKPAPQARPEGWTRPPAEKKKASPLARVIRTGDVADNGADAFNYDYGSRWRTAAAKRWAGVHDPGGTAAASTDSVASNGQAPIPGRGAAEWPRPSNGNAPSNGNGPPVSTPTPWRPTPVGTTNAPTASTASAPAPRHDGDLTVADGVVAHRIYDPTTKTYRITEVA